MLIKYAFIGNQRGRADECINRRAFFHASLKSDARQFGKAVQGHWGIENSLHGVLDVILREDECRIQGGEAAEDLCTLRHFAFNLLKQENTLKKGIKQKRLRAGWDEIIPIALRYCLDKILLMFLPWRMRYCCDCLSRCYLL